MSIFFIEIWPGYIERFDTDEIISARKYITKSKVSLYEVDIQKKLSVLPPDRYTFANKKQHDKFFNKVKSNLIKKSCEN